MICLETQEHQGILTLTMNRPEVHNAFGDELVGALIEALEGAAARDDLRALVLTGAGKSFSAGADLDWMRGMAEAGEEANTRDALRLARLMRALNYLPFPTVARVNGPAFGGGVGLVACCDIAVAVDSARFGLTEARLGLAPAVISPYVVRAIGERQARRWFVSAERFDAATAREIGLVHETVPAGDLDAAVAGQLDLLAAAGPRAARECKALALRIAGHDADEQERMDQHTARLIARLRVSDEGQEGMRAFLDKRRPGWRSGD